MSVSLNSYEFNCRLTANNTPDTTIMVGQGITFRIARIPSSGQTAKWTGKNPNGTYIDQFVPNFSPDSNGTWQATYPNYQENDIGYYTRQAHIYDDTNTEVCTTNAINITVNSASPSLENTISGHVFIDSNRDNT